MKIKQVIIWLTILVPLFSEEFDSIQSNYLDSNNKPSHKIFLEDHGISKQNTTIKLTPYFSVSFSKNEKSHDDFINIASHVGSILSPK